MKIHVIGNPQAGRGVITKRWDELLGSMRRDGAEATGVLTEGPGHATELTTAAIHAEADMVVAAGGDGTVHEVVNGLLEEQSADGPVLGVVPVGSGCDYVKTFGIPIGIDGAVDRLLAETPTRTVDAGEIRCIRGDSEIIRYFANIAEVGIGPEIVARARRMPRSLGPLMYLAAFWLSLPRYEKRISAIRMDRATFEGPVMDVVVAVGQVFGGGMRVAPKADPSDGVFDVQVHFGTKVDYLKGIAKVYRGTHIPHPRVQEELASVVEITCSPPGLIEADGEVVGHTPATFRTLPGALRLKV